MLPADLNAVLAVQAACYPAPMQEAAAVLLARLRVAPDSCSVGCDAAGVCGYLFAYPSTLGAVTGLGAPFEIARRADTLYLHDLALATGALGRGLGRALVTQALARAGDLAHSALVSVQDSARFWNGLGYHPRPLPRAALAGYPGGALYMVRTPA